MSAETWAPALPNSTMTTDTTATGRALSWEPSRDAARKILAGFAVGGGAIGLVGFSVSFASVMNAAWPYLGWACWTLPLLVDLAIFVLSGVALFLELHEISSRWIRTIPLALAGFTVYLNTAEQPNVFGKAVHAAGPVLWVVVVEIGTYVVRRLVGLASERHMDKVRASRWLLAPLSTFRLWRRMRLWEITSYRAAVGREHDLTAARALLRQWYGFGWRSKAPRAERLAVALQGASDRPVADVLTAASAGIVAAAAAARKPGISASENAREAGSEQDSNADSETARSGQTTATKRPIGRPKTGHKTAEKVATIAAKFPDATTGELAKRARLSERTVRRYLSPVAPSVEPVTHANGHDLAEQAA